ncbi:MAG: alpha/beta fold hydrolase [Synechococcus sp. Tobar2m-G35]|nr:alpha/beta fold hydrolase [Synechococcus sp. Tobar2m-G35]
MLPGPAGTASPVVLVHGFGASSGHWRAVMAPLAQDRPVWAPDLLGFGASAMPPSRLDGEPPAPGAVRYGFDLWARQLADFVLDQVAPDGTPVQLVGNSVGALAVLRAAELLLQAGRPPVQLILIDCAQRRLDDKRLGEQPPLARLGRPLLKQLVRRRAVIQPLLRLLARPAAVRQALAQAYPSGSHCDDELLELLLAPSRREEASESFRGFVNLFNEELAPSLLARLPVPVRLLWGEADPWEPVAEAHDWARSFACIRELVVLPGLGHCPFDEDPDTVVPILRRWLAEPPPTD